MRRHVFMSKCQKSSVARSVQPVVNLSACHCWVIWHKLGGRNFGNSASIHSCFAQYLTKYYWSKWRASCPLLYWEHTISYDQYFNAYLFSFSVWTFLCQQESTELTHKMDLITQTHQTPRMEPLILLLPQFTQ